MMQLEQALAECRALIREERALHQVDGLRGEAVHRMRAAFEQLVRVVSG